VDEIAYSWVLAVVSGLLFAFLAYRIP